jgi:hypothetical protein
MYGHHAVDVGRDEAGARAQARMWCIMGLGRALARGLERRHEFFFFLSQFLFSKKIQNNTKFTLLSNFKVV